MRFPMHLHSVGSISPSWWVCVGLYYVILYYLRLDQIRLDEILIISMTLMISSGTMNQREKKIKVGGEKTSVCACACTGECSCVCVLWFDRDLPNESKARQQREGRPFETRKDRDRQTISSSSVCVCVHTNVQSVSTRMHSQTPRLPTYCNVVVGFFIFSTFYIVVASWWPPNYMREICKDATRKNS